MRKGILILTILILLGGGAWYFYTRSKSSQDTNTPSSGFKSFFSFGGDNNSDQQTGTISQDGTTPTNSEIPKQNNSPFKQLTSHTVAGYSAFTTSTVVTTPASTPKGKPTTETIIDHVLRYVSRNSGYVYEIRNGGIPIQITNIYAANIYEAYFADKGKTALLRFLRDDTKTIATYGVPIPEKNPDGTRTQKNGFYLPDNILSMAISIDGGTVARLTLDGTTAVLSSTTSNNSNRKEFLRSPFKEWLVSWGGKSVYLQSKASARVGGFLYKVDESSRKLIRVLGNIPGLTASVSPSGAYILYSESTQRGFITKLLDTKTGTSKNIGNSILPEKCVWLKNEDLVCAGGGTIPEDTYPDAWYAGTAHFSDQLLRIYTSANIFDVLYNGEGDQDFDMTNLQIDEDNNILYFIDKPTGILWQFSL